MTRQPELWQSIEELSDGTREPLAGEPGPPPGPLTNRRTLLQLVAASLAGGALSGCAEPAIAPLLSAPVGDWREDADELLTYATTLDLDGFGRGVLVKTQGGRPVKIEGNLRHPASLGATDVFAQADVLSLYDPDRSRLASGDGLEDALAPLCSLGEDLKKSGGEGLRLLTGPVSSPSLRRLIAAVLREFPGARWHQYAAVANDNAHAAAMAAFGEPVDAVYDFTRADTVVTLGGDVLGTGPGQVRYAHDYAERRRRGRADGALPCLYSIEPTPSLTGARADRRVPLHPADVERFARALGEHLGLLDASDLEPHPAAAGIAESLRAAGSRGLVVAGPEQSPGVQALAHAANVTLGAVGGTVRYIAPVAADAAHMASLASLARDIEAGRVSALVVLDANPVYHAPGDMDFAALMQRVPATVHAGFSRDETGAVANRHVPLLHPLERWGDARAFDGTASLRQPATVPLVPAFEPEQVLGALAGTALEAREVVRQHWREVWGEADFEAAWHAALVAGAIPDSAAAPRDVRLRPAWDEGWAAGWSAPTATPMTVLFAPDPAVWDGDYADNAWLQEMPRPLTKIVWDNAAFVAPATAADLNLATGDVIDITGPDGGILSAPIWVLPGQASDTITLPLGYGRWRAGDLGTFVGFRAGSLRRVQAPWMLQPVTVAPAGRTHDLVNTQGHHRMEGRDLVRLVAPGGEIDDPGLAAPSLYPDWEYDGYAWGMAIDLDACLGCNACVIACQAENNVPVVGREQVALGREMHWLRIDRYHAESPEDPETYFQPLLCMHCEKAPCEVVCPVNATVHSSEGLNQMVYSRCIGTRTCSNNCPYKVRRFNWYDYTSQENAAVIGNPDVHVRPRGVMEKCTYCVQRIRSARIEADMEGHPVRDGDIVTACQQVCPTNAIHFGDVNDPSSAVSRYKAGPRNYGLLGELDTRPRTTYLARVAAIRPPGEPE